MVASAKGQSATAAQQAPPVPQANPTPVKPQPAFRIVTPKRADRQLKLLVYGDYGTGKTTLAASADDLPGMRDVLILDAEAGDLSLTDRPRVDRIGVSSFRQLQVIFDFLKLHCRFREEGDEDSLRKLDEKFRGEGQGIARKYNTVIIDSLTEFHKYAMYQAQGIQLGNIRLDADSEQPGFQEWGESSRKIENMVREFRNLPMHVVFIASERTVEDERKVQIKRPNLPGKLAIDVQGFMDVVGFLAMSTSGDGNVLRRLFLEPGRTYSAKNRFVGSKVTHLDNPTMADLVKVSLQEKD